MAVICAFITYVGTLEKRESVETVIHTYRVIESAEKILSLLKDMESGHRGYIITRDSAFLEPYVEANAMLGTEIATLKVLVRDSSQSRFLHNKIIPAVTKRQNASINTIDILNKQGPDSAREWIATRIGKAYMDTIRLLINNFNQNEQVLLTVREDELEKNIIVEDVIQFSSFAVIGITCTLAFLRLIRERKSINTLLDKLEMANESLEKKVLARTQQLTEANRAKDHFLAIASHDLKVPIAGVMGLIEIMRLDNNNRDLRDVEYLSYIEESCQGMQNLISNLLDINRIDRGETHLVKERIDLFPFLTKIEQSFASYAKKKSIPLHVEKVNTVIEADPVNLSRILENLISNAIKFSQPGHAVAVKSQVDDQLISFDIIDHGPGIPESELPDLFKKFSRLSNRPTGGESSSGLGLAIVKELTELAGGKLNVVSRTGQGTTFTVRLPIY